MPPIPFVSNTLSDMPHGKHMRVPDLRLLFRGCDFRDRSQSQHHLSASNNLKSNRLTTIASVVFNCAKARFIPTHTLDPRERLSMEAVRIYIYARTRREGRRTGTHSRESYACNCMELIRRNYEQTAQSHT